MRIVLHGSERLNLRQFDNQEVDTSFTVAIYLVESFQLVVAAGGSLMRLED
jgi:hypothetical protein